MTPAKPDIDTASHPAFEAEARRMGSLFFRRQWQGALGVVVGVLFWFAIVVGCCFLMPPAHPHLDLFLMFGICLLGFVPLTRWQKHSKASLHRLLAVKCPQCGGAARFETVPLPDTHIYLVCPHCQSRADTGFSVPFNWKTGGRYSMFYNWESRKMMQPDVMVHVRRLRGNNKKS